MRRRETRSLVLTILAVGLAVSGARAQDGAPLPPTPPTPPNAAPPAPNSGPRVLRLSIADVATLALRNSPTLAARLLDPAIEDTRIVEALGEFDPLFGARVSGGHAHTESFFDPTSFGGGGGAFTAEDVLGGDVGLSKTEEWGGRWDLGYGATSTDRRGAGSVTTLQPRYDGALSLGYTHPLLRGAGRDVRLSRVREAKELTREAEQRLLRTAEEIVAGAEAAYWDLAGALADRDLRRKSLDVARSLVEVTKARLAAETAVAADVAEAESGFELRRVDLIASDNRVANASDHLREVVMPFTGDAPDLGLTLEPSDRPATSGVSAPGAVTLENLIAMFEVRGDVLAAAQRVEAAKQALIRAENDVDPELNAFATGVLDGLGSGFSDSTRQISRREAYRWEAGLELNVPLGNLAAEARRHRARLEILRRQRDLDAVRNASVSELRRANNDLAAAAERIVAAEAATRAARLQLSAERARLRNGASTPFRVLQVEEDETAAEIAAIQARVDWEKARVAKDLAAGRVLSSRSLAVPAAEAE